MGTLSLCWWVGFLFSPMPSSVSVYITILGLPVHVFNSTMNVVMPCKVVEALVAELLVVSSSISSRLSMRPPPQTFWAIVPLHLPESAFGYSYHGATMLYWFILVELLSSSVVSLLPCFIFVMVCIYGRVMYLQSMFHTACLASYAVLSVAFYCLILFIEVGSSLRFAAGP